MNSAGLRRTSGVFAAMSASSGLIGVESVESWSRSSLGGRAPGGDDMCDASPTRFYQIYDRINKARMI